MKTANLFIAQMNSEFRGASQIADTPQEQKLVTQPFSSPSIME